jgi:hypothetical protein
VWLVVACTFVGLVMGGLGLFLHFQDGSNDEDRAAEQKTTRTTTEAPAEQTEVTGQIVLKPVAGSGASGLASVGASGDDPVLLVRGTLAPLPRSEAYEVWLYNSRDDARSMGAQHPDAKGNFAGSGPLPEDFESYQFVDISRESLDDGDDGHSGRSVVRGRIRDLEPVAPGNAPPDRGSGD